MTLFKYKYRIEPARLKNWDYGNNASYFVTICSKNREHFFGKITDGKMILSGIGKNAQTYWEEIPIHFPYVILGPFVIMPNHIHGILIINKPETNPHRRDAIHRVSNNHVSTPPISTPVNPNPSIPENRKPGGITGQHNPMNHQNIPRIIRWYKGRVTFESKK
jgi:putative transposase